MKFPNKRELQQIAQNHLSDISSKDFIKIYKKCTAESYSFLVNDATLGSGNPLRFRKNLFNIYQHPSNQQKIMGQAKFTYSPLGKTSEKQIKTIENQGEKQIKSLKDLKTEEQTKSVEEIFPKGYEKAEIKIKINNIKNMKKRSIETI